MVIQQSPSPHGFGSVLAAIGAVLCFVLPIFALVGDHTPMAICLLLAVVTWSSIIFGVRVFIGRARGHHDTKA